MIQHPSNMPAIYESLYDKITDRTVFEQDRWYKSPSDAKTIMFLDWYYKNTGCIEFSDNRTHFRIVFWPVSTLTRKPGATVSDGHAFYSRAYTPEELSKQREIHSGPNKGVPGVCSSQEIAIEVCRKHNVPYQPVSGDVSNELPQHGMLIPPGGESHSNRRKTPYIDPLDFDDL